MAHNWQVYKKRNILIIGRAWAKRQLSFWDRQNYGEQNIFTKGHHDFHMYYNVIISTLPNLQKFVN